MEQLDSVDVLARYSQFNQAVNKILSIRKGLHIGHRPLVVPPYTADKQTHKQINYYSYKLVNKTVTLTS